MVRKRADERWETKLANCEITLQAIRPIGKSLSKSGGPKAPSTIRGPLGPKFHPINKANIIAECLENQSGARDCVHVAFIIPFVYNYKITQDTGKNNTYEVQ
jgi:hypothetical protein